MAPPAEFHLLDAAMFWTPHGIGGVKRVLEVKRAYLLEKSCRHTLLAPGAQGPDTIDCGGVPLPGSGGYRFVVARQRAARRIEAAAPDIIEAADPYTLGWSVLDASARLGVPAVAFCHSNLPTLMARLVGGPRATATRRGRWAERQAARYLERLYAGYDLVLAPSRTLARELHQLDVRRVVHQPLGVDVSVFRPSANDPRWRSRLHEELGLAPSTRLLVYAGRFAAEKNLDLLVAATRRLGAHCALIAVGGGPRPPRGPQVRVLPAQTDPRRLARLLASADVFVHAGDQETFGLAALEAMACGTPVVVSAAGGLGELADEAGVRVASREPEAWAEAIAACLAGPDSQHLQHALARARALAWPRVMAQWTARYRQAIAARQGRHAADSSMEGGLA